MTLKTFPNFSPVWKTRPAVSFAVNSARFGDGYSQRSPKGLNSRSEMWQMKFILSHDDALAVRAFLDEHAGVHAFLWTPKGEEEKKYVSSAYTGPTVLSSDKSELSCRFEQVFDL